MDKDQLDQQRVPQLQAYDNYAEDEIDLRELFGILWAEKWLIIVVTAVAAVISVVVALRMTDIYTAEATLAAAEGEQSSSGLAAQLGGAAALLGVNLGGSSGDGVVTAIAILRSRQFLVRFINKNELLVPLFAASWDAETQTSVIDQEIYDAIANRWLLATGQPSELEAYRRFSQILSVSDPNSSTGIVTVSIEWHNPEQAANWVNKLVAELNDEIKLRDVQEANSAIEYLRTQLDSTQLVDMQRVFYQLIESQTRITMLADVRDEYVFRVIDPAVIPDQRSAPRRSLLVIIGTLAGAMFSLLLAFVRRATFKSN